MEYIRILSGASIIPVSLIFLVLALPLLGGIGVWAISLYGQTIPGNRWRDQRDAIIWTSCGLTLLGTLALKPYWGAEFVVSGAGGVGYSFGVDGLRYTLAVLVATLWLVSSLFSRWYLAQSGHKMRYYFFFLFGETGILWVLLSADLYTLVTGFMLLTISSWVLTGHRENEAARAAARNSLINGIVGGLCALIGILLLTNLLGTVRFSALQVLGRSCKNRPMLYLAGGLILLGISLCCAVWPLPNRSPGLDFAPGPAAALLAGAVTVAWLFSAIVLSGLLFWWDPGWGAALILLGLLLTLLPASAAMVCQNLKKTLSLLSVHQTGLILLTLGLNCLLNSKNHIAAAAVVLLCLHHGLCQMLLFLCAGTICVHQSDLSLSSVCGFGRGKPALFIGFLLGGASLCGMPLFFGAVNLTLVHTALRQLLVQTQVSGSGAFLVQGLSAAIILSCGICTAAVLKLLVCLFLRPNADPALQARYDGLNERGASLLTRILLLLIGFVLLGAGLTASVTLRQIAASAVGFFSTSLREPISPYFWESFLLAGLHLLIGGLLYLCFVHRPLKKMSQSKPAEK